MASRTKVLQATNARRSRGNIVIQTANNIPRVGADARMRINKTVRFTSSASIKKILASLREEARKQSRWDLPQQWTGIILSSRAFKAMPPVPTEAET